MKIKKKTKSIYRYLLPVLLHALVCNDLDMVPTLKDFIVLLKTKLNTCVSQLKNSENATLCSFGKNHWFEVIYNSTLQSVWTMYPIKNLNQDSQYMYICKLYIYTDIAILIMQVLYKLSLKNMEKFGLAMVSGI